jgi:hypothetical protein
MSMITATKADERGEPAQQRRSLLRTLTAIWARLAERAALQVVID